MTSPVRGSATAFTSRGIIITPSLAMAAYAFQSCSGVTATSCPNAMVARVRADQCSIGGTSPADSPGSPTPVFAPKPKSLA
jgi:hypothetical protein